MTNEFPIFQLIYPELKFWVSVIGALWAVFNGVQWIKSIKTNDLPHIQAGVDALQQEIKEQTTAIVGELRETRNEFRTYYTSSKRRSSKSARERRNK